MGEEREWREYVDEVRKDGQDVEDRQSDAVDEVEADEKSVAARRAR